MELSQWFARVWGSPTGSIRAHRLRPSAMTPAVEPLESRLYLGALPGAEAVVWVDPADALPPEPAVVELVSYQAEAGLEDESLLEVPSQDPAEVNSHAAGDSTASSQSGNAANDLTASTAGGLTGDALDPEVLPTALADDAPANESAPEALVFSTLISMSTTSSNEGAEENVLEVPDPAAGGANGGTVPFGGNMELQSSDDGEVNPATVGFGGVAASSLINNSEDPLVIKYDFRDEEGFSNSLNAEQQAVVERALSDWSEVLHGAVQFVRDTSAPSEQILNIGMGNLAVFGGFQSAPDGTLALSGGELSINEEGQPNLSGLIWLDHREDWDNQIGNGNVDGTYDLYTVVSHEVGNALGIEDAPYNDPGILNGGYVGERSMVDLYNTVLMSGLLESQPWTDVDQYATGVSAMMADPPQIDSVEVQQMLATASMVTESEDAIIAIVDRNGRILGVRVEQDVLDTITDPATLVFAIDGAVAKARTAAFFANGDPANVDEFSPNGTATPLTSRLVRFISQSTMTEREVASNPNVADPNSNLRGPGFVAPIGLGGHFPPETLDTPPVDLFRIEHTNRDSIIHPGDDLIRGTADDFLLRNTVVDGQMRGRFNIDPAFVPAGQELFAPESYGFTSTLLPSAQSRGIATLPGGIPLFRDTNGDLIGDTLVGGVGVFFPGTTGDATFEQNFIPGIGQSEFDRTNAPKVLEAEFIALVTAGGSVQAFQAGATSAKPVASEFDLPFGRLDLVGIQLSAVGPTPGIQGVIDLLDFGFGLTNDELLPGANSGADQVVNPGADMMLGTMDDVFYDDGKAVPQGWLVMPHDSTDGTLTAAQVEQIIQQARDASERTRSAIRLTAGDNPRPGSRARMVIAVADTNGEILGLFRETDSTIFSIDVAVAKSRNTAYYADETVLQPEDQVPGVDAGTAFTNRTFRFLAEPRFPSGVDESTPPVFSILNAPGIDPLTGENTGAPLPASVYNNTVSGFDSFNPMSNFRDPGDAGVVAAGGAVQPKANQNGIVFFPGSTPLYVNGGTDLAGGFGISGDGVDQDDVVTFLGAQGFLPDGQQIQRADQAFVEGVRLPYQKFLRNPFG